jgi:hypothetical protein
MSTQTRQGWALPDGQRVAEIAEEPAHLVITVDENMVGDRIEVWGQVEYLRANGHRAIWYPNAGTLAVILQNPDLRRMIARLLRQ